MITQTIKNSRALVLDKRLQDWPAIKSQFMDYGLSVRLFLAGGSEPYPKDTYDHIDINELPPIYSNSIDYPTWFLRPNAYNAWLSHKKILEQTLNEGFDHVLIIEDDSFIENDFKEVLTKVTPFFEQNKYDMVYFGGYHYNGSWEHTSNENVIKLRGSGGWHGVLITKPVIELLLTFKPIGPYDWICGKYIHHVFDCYAIYPSIISQKSGFSFVEGHDLVKPARDFR